MSILEDKKGMTLQAAKGIAAAAERFAAANGLKLVIAVLDDGGNLLYLERMDGGLIGSVEIAQQKARTAVNFKSPSKAFEDGLSGGGLSLLKLDVLPYEGGVAILVGGKVIGAVGVSGGTAAQDGQAAQAGVDWLYAALKE